MKNIFLFLLLVSVLASCSVTKSSQKKNLKASQAVLPDAVPSGIYIGMPESRFLETVGKGLKANDESFRYTYVQPIDNGANGVEYVVYYFDADGDKPLYEIIAIYSQESQRDQEAERLFGAPNHEKKEWRLTIPDSFNVWSWPYKNKLIVVGMIPGTEWSDKNWE